MKEKPDTSDVHLVHLAREKALKKSEQPSPFEVWENWLDRVVEWLAWLLTLGLGALVFILIYLL